MNERYRQVLVAVPLLATIGCDQATKHLARSLLAAGPVTSAPLTFVRAQNPGAFLSVGAGLPEWLRYGLFTLSVAVALLLGVRALLASAGASPTFSIAGALMAGGGAGNLIDRLREGSVTDFVIFRAAGFSTGIFNIADVAITAGALLLLASARNHPPSQPRPPEKDRSTRS